MAGIAFRLQKLISGESYTDLIRAYLYSSMIASGPFLVVILSMSLLRVGIQTRLSIDESQLFMALIVYAYAFSMLGTSPFIYMVTRYLADKYYMKQVDAFTPTYLSVLEIVFVIQSVVAIAFLGALELLPTTKIILFCLFLFLSGIWIAMIFLSAARNYLWIVAAFAAGGLVTVATSLLFGRDIGMNGFLLGFTFGQSICFLILSLRVFLEFGFTASHDYSFLHYFSKFPELVLVGVFYFLGIWIDKFIFWFSPAGEKVISGLHVFPDYDTPMFLAYVSVIPSMAFFLVQMETSFVKHYYNYYDSIRKRDTLSSIRQKRATMMENITANFQKFVVFQGALTGFIILLIYEIADTFYLNPAQMGVLRIGLLGAFLQMAFLMVINVLFYFDLQKDILRMVVVFFLCNGVLTWVSYRIGLPAYGFGYTGACFVALFCGILTLDYRLKNLDYLTFMRQPIVVPKFKLEAETRK